MEYIPKDAEYTA